MQKARMRHGQYVLHLSEFSHKIQNYVFHRYKYNFTDKPIIFFLLGKSLVRINSNDLIFFRMLQVLKSLIMH